VRGGWKGVATFDLVIRGGRVYSAAEGTFSEKEICISEGKIASIERPSGRPTASRTIDAEGMLILPGLIDSHVHFRDPGLTHKEDFETGTKGAAAGGVSLVFDMPTTVPVVTNASLFREKLETIGGKAVVDFALFGAAAISNLEEIHKLARAGAVAFKTYTVSPPKERLKEYEGSFITNSGELLQVMERVSKTGLVHCIHAEDDSTIGCLTDRMKFEGRKDPLAHYDSRPNFTEAQAVFDAITLSGATGARVHIVHVSTAEAATLLRQAKLVKSSQVSAETCPHYLYFTKEILQRKGPYAKYNPPARNQEDMQALIAAINDGSIDVVVTDHAPHSKEEKEKGEEDIFRAPPGTPGVETRLPLLFTMAYKGLIPLESIPRISSESVARIFNLYPRKGTLSVGSDADLAIVDYGKIWQIKAEKLQTKAWETVLFDGMEVRGRVRQTIVRGNIVYEDEVGFGKMGTGELIRGEAKP
jgi:allantoinase